MHLLIQSFLTTTLMYEKHIVCKKRVDKMREKCVVIVVRHIFELHMPQQFNTSFHRISLGDHMPLTLKQRFAENSKNQHKIFQTM
jgi:hypothetical protein